MTRVGVIGTGRMGNAFALNLLKAGHEVYVYDAMPAATQNLVQKGSIRGESPADIASVVDFLITSLPRSEIVEEVIIGRDGAKNRLRSGSIVIDMSTTHPRSSNTNEGGAQGSRGHDTSRKDARQKIYPCPCVAAV